MKKLNAKEALASFTKASGLREKAIAAFTLIEILIVVAIIGIILGIAVPALNTAREDALQTKKNALEAQLATAKTRYYLKNPNIAENTPLAFTDIAPYLSVNGVPNPSQTNFLGGFSDVYVGNATQNSVVTR